MKFEYLHFFRDESQDFSESEFLALKGEEGWELVTVLTEDQQVRYGDGTSSVRSESIRLWHYYFKKIISSGYAVMD